MSRSQRTKKIEEIQRKYVRGDVPVRFRVAAADGSPFGGMSVDVRGINHLILQTLQRGHRASDDAARLAG